MDWLRAEIKVWRENRAKRAEQSARRRQEAEDREQAIRDADTARYRLSMDHAAETQRKLIDELAEQIEKQGRRIEALESDQKATLKEMMRLQVDRAQCRAETAALKREIEALKAARQ